MKIERIDDKTVKCFLSNEELEEYDIDYKDFVTRSDKAKEVVQEIIEQAEEEVGYKPPKYAFDLQIMMLPPPPPRSYATLGLGPRWRETHSNSSGRPCSPGHRRLGRVPVPDHDHPAAFPRPQNNAINHGAGRCVRSVGRSILRWLRTQTCGERAKRDAGRRARGRTQWPQQAKRRARTHARRHV